MILWQLKKIINCSSGSSHCKWFSAHVCIIRIAYLAIRHGNHRANDIQIKLNTRKNQERSEVG